MSPCFLERRRRWPWPAAAWGAGSFRPYGPPGQRRDVDRPSHHYGRRPCRSRAARAPHGPDTNALRPRSGSCASPASVHFSSCGTCRSVWLVSSGLLLVIGITSPRASRDMPPTGAASPSRLCDWYTWRLLRYGSEGSSCSRLSSGLGAGMASRCHRHGGESILSARRRLLLLVVLTGVYNGGRNYRPSRPSGRRPMEAHSWPRS